MLKNIFYITSSIIFFFVGIIVYGIILNLKEITLSEAMKEKDLNVITNPSIIINRKNYTLDLYSDSIKVKQYKVVFGRNNGFDKKSKDDFITPIGNYKICGIDTNFIYYKRLKLNYPNIQDANKNLKNGIISKVEFLTIMNSLKNNKCSYDYTKLGGNISIHGIGKYNLIFKNLPFVFNWTNGSIALSNENIDELYSVVNIGTKVKIIH
jgi:murein L,D-transpeptidase YafK